MLIRRIRNKARRAAVRSFVPLALISFLLLTLFTSSACAEKETLELPANFPDIITTGKSKIAGEFYTVFNGIDGYFIAKMNEGGEVTWLKQVGDYSPAEIGAVLNFQPADTDGLYFYFERRTANRQLEAYCELVMLDENLGEIQRVQYTPSEGDAFFGGTKGQLIDPHDAIVFDTDSYIICTSDIREVDNIPAEVNPTAETSAEVVLIKEVADGEVVWEFSSGDYPEFYRYKMGRQNKYDNFREDFFDFMHFNSMAIDPADGNLLVSFRNQCSIIKIDRQTGKLLWIMGGKGDEFGLDEEMQFMCQHAISFVGEGRILMYDNRIEGENSRILELEFDERRKTATLIRSVWLEADSTNWGYVEKLDEHTYLVNEGQASGLEYRNGFYELDLESGKTTVKVKYEGANDSRWVAKKIRTSDG